MLVLSHKRNYGQQWEIIPTLALCMPWDPNLSNLVLQGSVLLLSFFIAMDICSPNRFRLLRAQYIYVQSNVFFKIKISLNSKH